MIDKLFVTTFNKKLYDSYCSHFLDSYINTKQQLPLYVYTEDDVNLFPVLKNVKYFNLFDEEPDCKDFVDRNSDRPGRFDRFDSDAVRFNFKVFAMNAVRKHAEKIYWIDADSIFVKQMPLEWFDEFLPDNITISCYDRNPQQYTETGFVGLNNGHKVLPEFFTKFKEYYINDTIYDLEGQLDCHAFDDTVKQFIDNDNFSYKKMGDGNPGHIIARDKFINPYIDHKKGKRKFEQHSPEWRNNVN